MDQELQQTVNPILQDVVSIHGKLSAEGIIVSVSGRLLDELSITPDSIRGRRLEDVFAAGQGSEQLPQISDALAKVLSGLPAKVAVVLNSDGSTTRTFELTLAPCDPGSPDEVLFAAYEVTEWESSARFAQRRRDFLLRASASAGIGFWFWDLDSGEAFSTSVCNKLFGLDRTDDLTFDRLIDSVLEDDRAEVEEALRDRRSEGPFHLEFRVVHEGGDEVWLSARGDVYEAPGKGDRILMGSAQDINELKSVNKELERIYKLERKARDEAEVAIQTKDYFLALVSHELRSPLNTILGWTRVLLEENAEEDVRRNALETIGRSARSQAKLIEDLIDSAGITSRKLKLDFRPLNAFHIVKNVVISHLPAAEEKGIELIFDPETETAEIVGDSQRLRQVFSNLLGNALKFTPSGGRIRLGLRVSGDDLHIFVEDNGKGIAEEELPEIFEQFRQGARHRHGKQKGLGLGLSIAKILVEEHGGTVSASSDGKGKGARFEVVLPMDNQSTIRQKAASGFETGKQAVRLEGALSGLDLLVVEDDPDSRKVLEIFLTQVGAEVRSAESVAEAFSLLASEEALPDVIISDLGMPEADGFYFASTLRASERYRYVPLIALSAFSSEWYRTKASESGFQKYHTKPFVPDLLMEEVLELANKKRAA